MPQQYTRTLLPASLRIPGENVLLAVRVVAGLSDDERSTLRACHGGGSCLVYSESRTPDLEVIGSFSAPPVDGDGKAIRNFTYKVNARGRAFAAIADAMTEGQIDARC